MSTFLHHHCSGEVVPGIRFQASPQEHKETTVLKVEPLTREEVVSVIEGRARTRRVPQFIHFWVHSSSFGDRQAAVQAILDAYPQDVQGVGIWTPAQYRGDNPEFPDYSWLPFPKPTEARQTGIDAACSMPEWDVLDEVIAKFPKTDFPRLFPNAPAPDGRYRLGMWWFCFFERHWSLRGMTNALTDYYTNPDEVHRLFNTLTEFYCGIIDRAATEQKCDGIFTSDDLGTQTGEFFSPEIFREFFKPYYKRLIDRCHLHKMHFWLHVCGCVTKFIPEWTEIGLDVIHPIQKHTMDEKEIARLHGKDITIFTGLDVQQVIPWGTPDDVRKEVRFLLDTYWRPGEGRCMLTAGNGINGDCTLESLEAFFDEAITYGAKKARE